MSNNYEVKFEDLTEGQKNAWTIALEVCSGQEPRHLVIKGPAGTGKTTATKFIIRSLINKGIKGIILAAPTHQAKKVLSNLSGIEAATIHSVLKIKPDTYEDTQEFNQKETPDLSECRVLILDELSFYDTDLFNILLKTLPSRCKIIGLGDSDQIRAVSRNGESEISPFFNENDKRFVTVELTDVKRAKGAVLQVATKIRNFEWTSALEQESVVDEEESVERMESAKALISKYMENVKTPADFEENRILCYTNKLVDTCNKVVRKRIYGDDVEDFIKDEILVMQEPLTKVVNIPGSKSIEETVFSNSEWVRVMSATPKSGFFALPGVSGKLLIRYWELTLQSTEDKSKVDTIFNISDPDEALKLKNLLSDAASNYKTNRNIKPAWKPWWKLKNTFKSVKHLPACTFHKSQGSSIENTYVFASQIDSAWHLSAEERKELLYTGFSRARKHVYFY